MIDLRGAALAALAATAMAVQGSAQQAPQPGSSQPPATQTAAPAAAQPVPGTVTCPAPAPPATLPTRMFNAPAGILIVPVQSTKVSDFEKFLGYVRDALATSTDPTVRNQAKGWKFFKAAETGQNGDVLFTFVFDPAVPCVDYGFAQILTPAIPDTAKLTEIWKLYRESVRGGGTLMNLVPLGAAPASGSSGASGTANPTAVPPLDANPVKPPG
jgi:hypothetical protein